MAEPPAKRAKRTDSSAMWERNTSRRSASPGQARPSNGNTEARGKDGDKRDDKDRHHGREDERYRSRSRDRRRERSRSRDRVEKRRDRSYSRERNSRRHRDGERNGGRDRRDRDKERSRSRERHRPRRDEPPSKRARSRSASPRKENTSTRTRTRTPPRSSKPTVRPTVPPTAPRSSQKAPPGSKLALSPSTNGHTNPTNGTADIKPTPEEMDIDSDPETAEMRRAMGFTGFKSTKNTKVKGNNVYGVRKEKKTEYRQYMNRVGGFNRPLSPSR